MRPRRSGGNSSPSGPRRSARRPARRDVAAAMGIDEIIHERETVEAIRRALVVLTPGGTSH